MPDIAGHRCCITGRLGAPGAQIAVLYDPQDPSRCFVDTTADIDGSLMGVGVGLLVALFGVAVARTFKR